MEQAFTDELKNHINFFIKQVNELEENTHLYLNNINNIFNKDEKLAYLFNQINQINQLTSQIDSIHSSEEINQQTESNIYNNDLDLNQSDLIENIITLQMLDETDPNHLESTNSELSNLDQESQTEHLSQLFDKMFTNVNEQSNMSRQNNMIDLSKYETKNIYDDMSDSELNMSDVE